MGEKTMENEGKYLKCLLFILNIVLTECCSTWCCHGTCLKKIQTIKTNFKLMFEI